MDLQGTTQQRSGTDGKDKAVVMGMMERGGNIRGFVVDDRRKARLQAEIREHVEAGTAIYSDELKSYDGLSEEYDHAVINHAVEYVQDSHQRNGKLLEFAEARSARHLHKRGTISSLPLHRRTGIPLQQPKGHERTQTASVFCSVTDHRKAAHLCGGDWQGGRSGV
jgi:transposase-like protein